MSLLPRTASLLLLATTATAQTTWHVDLNGAPPGTGTAADPYTSIQYAIDRATTVDGDTIRVAPGDYVDTLDFQLKAITVEATHGPTATWVRPPAGVSPLVTRGVAGPQSTLRGFTLAGPAYVPIGGGLRLERCVVRDNTNRGVENNQDLVAVNCDFVHNPGVAVFHYGSGHGSDATTLLESCVFWSNGQDYDGFGVAEPDFTVRHSVFEDPLHFGIYDYHLLTGSPCIDAGDPDATDPDGTRVDAGATPYDPNWPLGESYCTPVASSTGARATVRLSGSASVAANDLGLAAVRCPANASGLFFYGTERASLPFGDGVACVGGAVARLTPTPTGPLGAPSFALDLASLPGHVPPIAPGETRMFSYWFRDVAAGGAGFNFTNAVEVLFEP